MRQILLRAGRLCAVASALCLGGLAARGAVVAHWSFDEPGDRNIYPDDGGGTPAHNAFPRNQNVINVFGLEAPFGKAVQLNGKPGSFFNAPKLNDFQKGSFTVAVWFKTDEAGRNIILADWNKPDYSYIFGLEKKGDKQLPYVELQGVPTVTVDSRGKQTRKQEPVAKVLADKAVSAGQWHHLAWVWAKKDATKASMTIYLDGAKIIEQGNLNKKPLEILSNPRPTSIGFMEESNDVYNGELDELWVFNEALSATQVKNLMRHNNLEGTGDLAKVIPPEPVRTVAARSTPKPPAPAASTPPAVAAGPKPQETPRPTVEKPPAPAAVSTPPVTPPEPSPAVASNADKGGGGGGGDAADEAENPPQVANAASLMDTPDEPAAGPSPLPRATEPPVGVVSSVGMSSGRVAGIIACGAIELTLVSYFIWVMVERSKMHTA